jgi:FeS assembly SUF system protein
MDDHSSEQRIDPRARFADAGPPAPGELDTAAVVGAVIDEISQVYDPEIPVNVFELGLIYDVRVSGEGVVEIDMTLTSPACPVAGTLPGEVEMRARNVEGVKDVHVELVWEPFWRPEFMSEAARLELGFM